jgi:hypothetical protein
VKRDGQPQDDGGDNENRLPGYRHRFGSFSPERRP